MFSMRAFVDELEKLGAHTVQKCRTGSMPIRVAKLADKDVYDRSATKTAVDAATAESFAPLAKPLAVAALSIGSWEALRRANRDRQLGRQMRLQNNGY